MTGMMQKTGSAELLQEYLTRRNIRLVLASASPRRKELFHQAGLFPEIIPSRKEERSRAKTPAALVKALSKSRACAPALLADALMSFAAREEDSPCRVLDDALLPQPAIKIAIASMAANAHANANNLLRCRATVPPKKQVELFN